MQGRPSRTRIDQIAKGLVARHASTHHLDIERPGAISHDVFVS
jgi:hypothetical protein